MSNIYKNMSSEEYEDMLNNFMVDSWSYSKVSEFSRNEKSFEMSSIYGIRSKYSSSTVAGNAYHEALQTFFETLRDDKKELSLPELETIAFNYIDKVKHYVWKLQKTTPTINDCKEKALKTVSLLLKNFIYEKSIYLDELDEILFIEVYCDELLVINGVDIPLKCHAKIDLIIKTKDGKIIVIDHKTKSAFSSEDELAFSIGRQAITYAKCLEEKTGIKVDDVWFVENKYSQNRDKSKQLNCFKLTLDNDTIVLFEALLYEPLKRMIEAVSNPDYVYMINEQDNFIDKAELYAFWAKTQIAEVEDFNVKDNKKELVKKRLKKIRDASITVISPTVMKKFKENASEFIQYDLSNSDMTQEQKIEHVLRTFGVIVNVAHTFRGTSSNTYLLELSAGVKISSIKNYKLDIANVLNVSNVRMSNDLYVHEGKSYVSIEFSKERETDVIFDSKYLEGVKIPIGIDNFGKTVFWDLNNQSTPHALISGGSGSGKSISIKSTIEYALLAGVEQIEILDPKFEFVKYNSLPNINVYNEIEDIEQRAAELVDLMNDKIKNGKSNKIMVILDEFADAYMMASKGKELDIYENVIVGIGEKQKMTKQLIGKRKTLEENIQSLLQKGRSSGFRLIMATQRADTKTISGSAKVNLTVQICFRVQKEIDSRVVIDEAGAECLNGAGDGLIRSPEYPGIVRFQAFYKP